MLYLDGTNCIFREIASRGTYANPTEPARQLGVHPSYYEQELAALYGVKRGRAEIKIAMVRGLRGARSSGTSGMVHRAHGVDEAKLRSSKSSRKPKMTMKVPRKFQHSPQDKPSGGVAKPTRHHSQAAIQARCSANRPNRAASSLSANAKFGQLGRRAGTTLHRTQPSPLRYD